MSQYKPLESVFVAPAAVLTQREAEEEDCSSEDGEKSHYNASRLLRPSLPPPPPPPPPPSSHGGTNVKAPLTVVILIVLVLGAFHTGHSKLSSNTYRGISRLALTLDHVFNGTFNVDWGPTIDWLAEAGEGVYSTRLASHDILLTDLNTGETRTLVRGDQVLDRNGFQLWWRSFALSADGQYILFSTRWTKRWRYSGRADYFIHDMTSNTTTALVGVTEPPQTATAQWAPHGHALAFVEAGDLYVLPSPADSAAAVRVTGSGNMTIPWVYEEEVLMSDQAMRWSPDAARIAFLTFDESQVPLFNFSIYNPDPRAPDTLPYPDVVSIPYPKVGFPNPTVAAHVYILAERRLVSLDLDIAFKTHDRLINEVAWITPVDLLIKLTDRFGKHLQIVHYNLSAATVSASVIRDVNFADIDGGWIEPGATMVPIPGIPPSGIDTESLPIGYLDIIPDERGFRHIALFSPAESLEPIFLTSGQWEVVDRIQCVDLRRRLIYFSAADPFIDRRIRTVPLPTVVSLADVHSGNQPAYEEVTSEGGYYAASFSPQCNFFALTYAGPRLPTVHMMSVGNASFTTNLATNHALNDTLTTYAFPSKTFRTIAVGELNFTVLEILPPRFDSSRRKTYPVLFRCYGGPNSQLVSSRFLEDWHTYLASDLGYIVVMVDGRGTGFRGRRFRSPVSGQLGQLEAIDQIAVASAYANLSFVDRTKIGIWGWSYGGYLTAKVIEANSGIFSLGMSVAPVTDWRYYDSVYSERYMGDVNVNKEGYDHSAITHMEGFQHAAFFLAHGSGDDNVHLLNSANLLDRLTMEHVHGFRFRMFTDSDHSISRREAYRELFEEMTAFLIEHWGEAKTRYRRQSGTANFVPDR